MAYGAVPYCLAEQQATLIFIKEEERDVEEVNEYAWYIHYIKGFHRDVGTAQAFELST